MTPSYTCTFGTKVRPGNVVGAMQDIRRGTGYATDLYDYTTLHTIVLGSLGFERGRQPTTSMQ